MGDMGSLFDEAISFNSLLSTWNVTAVKSMYASFSQAVIFNQDIAEWNVSSVEDMSLLFYGAISYNQSLCTWGPTLAMGLNLFDGMFDASGCPSQANPVLNSDP